MTSPEQNAGHPLEVLCVGEALAMTYAPDDLASSDNAHLTVRTGGAESNVALHLAAQGIRTAWGSRVGGDPFGRKVLADLKRGGVDTSSVRVDEGRPTGMYLKASRADGSTEMHYYRTGSAAAHMDAADIEGFPVNQVPWVHVSGITVAISPTAALMVDALIGACRDRGVSVSFDVNFRPRLWSADQAAGALLRVAQQADVVFVGLDEASDLWGTASMDDVFTSIDAPSIVVVKDAGVGALEVDRRGSVDVRTFERTPPVEVVELIGAGDAFAGGYLAGLIRGECAEARLRRGHAAAAWVIGSWDDFRPGHRPAPFVRASIRETS